MLHDMSVPTRSIHASSQRPSDSRAERLAERIKAMPIETVRERITESRQMTSDEIVERQRIERRRRAEQTAARIRAI
jgi:hypothetical protein